MTSFSGEKKSLNPLVSIIIPLKNGLPVFKKTLLKIFEQDFDDRFELIIIDSGSSDGSVDFVKEMQRQNNSICLIEIPPQNFGHGKTRNLGATIAKGEFLVFITQDAIPANEYWLVNLIKPFYENPEIAGVFGRHLAHHDANIFLKNDLINHFSYYESHPLAKIEDFKLYKNDENYRFSLYFYSDNNSCMKKSIWKKIPYPDVDFAEDQLWAKLILEAGYAKFYSHDAIVFHSHNYSIIETFQRSFDEGNSLKKLFNREIVSSKKSFFSIFKLSFSQTKKEWEYLNRKRFFFLFIHRFFFLLSRSLGYHYGAKVKKNIWIQKISLDKKLQKK